MYYICGFILPHFFYNGFCTLLPAVTNPLKDKGQIDKTKAVFGAYGICRLNLPVSATAFRQKDLLCLS
jgi:hypothetical protein